MYRNEDNFFRLEAPARKIGLQINIEKAKYIATDRR